MAEPSKGTQSPSLMLTPTGRCDAGAAIPYEVPPGGRLRNEAGRTGVPRRREAAAASLSQGWVHGPAGVLPHVLSGDRRRAETQPLQRLSQLLFQCPQPRCRHGCNDASRRRQPAAPKALNELVQDRRPACRISPERRSAGGPAGSLQHLRPVPGRRRSAAPLPHRGTCVTKSHHSRGALHARGPERALVHRSSACNPTLHQRDRARRKPSGQGVLKGGGLAAVI